MNIEFNYNELAIHSKLFEIIKAIDAVIYDSEEYYDIRDYSVNNSDSIITRLSDNEYTYTVYHFDTKDILYRATIKIQMHNLSDIDYTYEVYTRLEEDTCELLEKEYRVMKSFYKHESVYK